MTSTPSSTWNPDLYTSKHQYVFQYGMDLMPLLEPRAGEKILDLGYGTVEHIENIAKPKLYKNGQWFADYKRLRIRAEK